MKKIFSFFLFVVILSGCVSTSALYEPAEGEGIGEGAISGVAAVFEIFDENGNRGFLTHYEPRFIGSLYPGKKVFLAGDSGKTYEATFRGFVKVNMEGVFDASFPTAEE
ncbi:MAG: hypothetical protein UR69_C0001G0166 [Candidatus Moranbacteria bacterium GW2011_GWE2_35_2-]|nr:MAG: hypothetical protein UR69_C0001G0166 [Candidatus Moranbacteria bacterium GW2011_GWE2_35_2-]KKQ06250.1 MAG: hypothetical protein US15_C0015G0015 [Candidatus Moranbacteria bacterium GW2011_GWF1_36_4]KKQ22836.1 MAG: hypothetical protein US37_C0001G0108 [Candidatus Moranbacteria bacterium GW2011_GWF2_37_11]KKQ28652.1 MAG: hypothetical protein US44_C0008G0026 [Candidatus Moranbacteria bacterium GW2011_GWD1_37_17]KKQ30933.1 MAG: hypothetical protein US47_C0001G0166 [Candidatus Moranbacteria b